MREPGENLACRSNPTSLYKIHAPVLAYLTLRKYLTLYFKQQKKRGRWFEAECEKLMRARGMEVIDIDKLSYRQKKGWDREVSVNGAKAKVEMKFDPMSKETGNVCVEISALRQSISPIWLYGLAEGSTGPFSCSHLRNTLIPRM